MFRELLEKLKESRLFLMSGIFFILACVLIHRLFVLQIIRGEEYQENYQLSIVKTKDIPATRGNIYDTNGTLLAYNDLAYSVKIEDVLNDVENILTGKYDEIDESKFLFIGKVS